MFLLSYIDCKPVQIAFMKYADIKTGIYKPVHKFLQLSKLLKGLELKNNQIDHY